MIQHTLVLAASTVPGSVASGVSTTGWWLGYAVGFLVLLVVLMLVIPILLLAHAIGKEATMINDSLTQAVHNTAPLAALSTTIEHATIIIAGLKRGRERLGG
jgi:ABC-type sulfate transport system permease component